MEKNLVLALKVVWTSNQFRMVSKFGVYDIPVSRSYSTLIGVASYEI